jgi:hypothetical protein
MKHWQGNRRVLTLSQERGATEALACLSLTYTATAMVEWESNGGWDNPPPQRTTTTAPGIDDDPLSAGSRDSNTRPEPSGGPLANGRQKLW